MLLKYTCCFSLPDLSKAFLDNADIDELAVALDGAVEPLGNIWNQANVDFVLK